MINSKGVLDLKPQHLALYWCDSRATTSGRHVQAVSPCPWGGFPSLWDNIPQAAPGAILTEGELCQTHPSCVAAPCGCSSCIAPPKAPTFLVVGANGQRGTGAPLASENLKTLILTTEILCFTEESFRKEEGSGMASQGVQALRSCRKAGTGCEPQCCWTMDPLHPSFNSGPRLPRQRRLTSWKQKLSLPHMPSQVISSEKQVLSLSLTKPR